jgi:protein-S-isoprenylcysteine O-methyltransferase Ste14
MTAAETANSERLSFLVRCGSFFFRYRNLVFPLAVAPLFFIFPPLYPGGSEMLDRWLDVAGLLVGLFGEAVRAVVVGLAYVKRGGVNKRVYADRLVTGGMFSHSRNPLYFANLLMVASLLILHNNPWVYLLGGGFFLFVYVAIIAAEERFLRTKFGSEYEDYTKRVNRWVPNPRGLGQTIRSGQFHWKRLVVKEYASAYSWTLAALALLAYGRIYHAGLSDWQIHLAPLAAVFVVATVLLVVVYTLKKTGRLRASHN